MDNPVAIRLPVAPTPSRPTPAMTHEESAAELLRAFFSAVLQSNQQLRPTQLAIERLSLLGDIAALSDRIIACLNPIAPHQGRYSIAASHSVSTPTSTTNFATGTDIDRLDPLLSFVSNWRGSNHDDWVRTRTTAAALTAMLLLAGVQRNTHHRLRSTNLHHALASPVLIVETTTTVDEKHENPSKSQTKNKPNLKGKTSTKTKTKAKVKHVRFAEEPHPHHEHPHPDPEPSALRPPKAAKLSTPPEATPKPASMAAFKETGPRFLTAVEAAEEFDALVREEEMAWSCTRPSNPSGTHYPVSMKIEGIATMGCVFCKVDLSFLPAAANGRSRRVYF